MLSWLLKAYLSLMIIIDQDQNIYTNSPVQESGKTVLRSITCIKTVFLVLVLSVLCLTKPAAARSSAEDEISAFNQSRIGTERIMLEGPEIYQFLIEAFAGLYTSVPLALYYD